VFGSMSGLFKSASVSFSSIHMFNLVLVFPIPDSIICAIDVSLSAAKKH